MTRNPADNRAVSAMFRAFGGAGRIVMGEARMESAFSGMHRGERIFLSVWMPLSVLVAAGDAVIGWFGVPSGLLLALPAAWSVLHVLPFVLQVRTPSSQWRAWLAAGVVWAWFHRDCGGVTAWFSVAWFLLLASNTAGMLWLGLVRTMEWKGRQGIAWRMALWVVPHVAAIVIGFRFGWAWALMAGAGMAAFYCLAVLRPGSQWLGPVVRRFDDGEVLVTIDDGPDPEDTPALLDLLDRHGVKAVFFMIGEKVAAHPELVREVIRRGHEIGNHTMTHPQATFWCAGPWRTRREIACCQRVIGEVAGVVPRWFRAPVGHRNFFTHPIAAEMGLQVMGWSRRGYDAVDTDAGRVLERILTGVLPGDIVLVHESTPVASEVLDGVLRGTAPCGSISSAGDGKEQAPAGSGCDRG